MSYVSFITHDFRKSTKISQFSMLFYFIIVCAIQIYYTFLLQCLFSIKFIFIFVIYIILNFIIENLYLLRIYLNSFLFSISLTSIQCYFLPFTYLFSILSLSHFFVFPSILSPSSSSSPPLLLKNSFLFPNIYSTCWSLFLSLSHERDNVIFTRISDLIHLSVWC